MPIRNVEEAKKNIENDYDSKTELKNAIDDYCIEDTLENISHNDLDFELKDMLNWVLESKDHENYVDDAIQENSEEGDYSIYSAIQTAQIMYNEKLLSSALDIIKKELGY